jgi:hypothetical protein
VKERCGDAFLCRYIVMTEFRHIFELVEETHSSADYE